MGTINLLLSRPWLFCISQKPNIIIVLLYIERKKKVWRVSGTDNLFLNVKKYLRFSQFFLFHVISKQLLCHLRRPFCVCESLSSTVFSMPCYICLAWSTKQTWKTCFCFFTDGKQHKARELDMITLRNHAPRSYMTWLPVTLSVLDMIIV